MDVRSFLYALKIPGIILFALLVVMATTYHTLSSNLTAGIYPSDADTIAIPLFETAVALIVILVPFALAYLLTNFVFAKRRLAVVLGVFSYLASALLAALMAWSWFTPHHYSIVTSYTIVVIAGVTLAVSAFRKRP